MRWQRHIQTEGVAYCCKYLSQRCTLLEGFINYLQLGTDVLIVLLVCAEGLRISEHGKRGGGDED